MVQRYAHLSPDHVRAAVEKLTRSETATCTATRGFGGNPGDDASAEEQMVTRVGIEPTTPGLKVPPQHDPIRFDLFGQG
jgi:hypothetical protein